MSLHRILTIEPKLHDFEVTQIINLCPHEAEEAKALVPRLVSFFPSLPSHKV